MGKLVREPNRRQVLVGGLAVLLGGGCSGGPPEAAPTSSSRTTSTSSAGTTTLARPTTAVAPPPTAAPVDRSPEAIATRATVPVLCWHQLREQTAADGAYARGVLVCPPAVFRDQLDALAGAGYTTITADQYLAHLTDGAELPERPVLLSFDDSQGTQISVGLPELIHRGMTATFFVMTVALDKPGWMSRADVRGLADRGMTVAAHTWDHHRADRYSGDDWRIQLVEPRAELEQIIGGPVRHFAYPFGAWNTDDFAHLADAGYATGFQLQSDPISASAPLLTLPRMLVGSEWSGATVVERAREMAAATPR